MKNNKKMSLWSQEFLSGSSDLGNQGRSQRKCKQKVLEVQKGHQSLLSLQANTRQQKSSEGEEAACLRRGRPVGAERTHEVEDGVQGDNTSIGESWPAAM